MPAFVQQAAVPPPPPATPPAPAAPGAVIVDARALPGAMMSRQEMAALRARRTELSNQLESAAGRRRELSEQLKSVNGADRAGLEARLAVLDGRIARLEGEIDEVGQQLASPAAARFTSSRTDQAPQGPPFMRIDSGDVIPIAGMLSVFVLFPLTLTIARLIWRRGSLPARSASPAESAQRLERMEQAIDTIAVEMERVSEGQRFVTRLLSERGGAALGAAQPAGEPVRVPRQDQAPVGS